MGYRVLIVDNAPNARELMRVNLEQHGHTVVGEAEGTADAVKLYIQFKPDLVTLDLFLNGEHGFDTLKAIRNWDNKARIIIISAIPDPATAIEARKLGAKAFVDKGNDWRQIEAALTQAVKD